MKTIFRYANVGILVAAIMAIGAVAGFAQDPPQNPCEDAAGITALDAKIREYLPKKAIEDRKVTIESSKQFIEKYGACEPNKEFTDYLKLQIPTMENALKKAIEAKEKADLLKRFDDSLTAKKWDDVYVSGKEILAKYPDEFRTVEIVLSSVGGEEAFKNNFKYSDDTLRYSKQSIADLEAGKSFTVGDKARYGLGAFEYPSKDDAIGWLNLYIGYVTQVGQKNKPGALSYLYKASQAGSSSNKNPIPYELIGSYYFDELNKVVEQIQAKAKEQKDTDPPDVIQKKVDEIKALVAMSNGINERAMDAFARASTLGKDAVYKAKMRKNVDDAYKLRFEKTTGVDAWITASIAKPFPDPKSPIAPISDPEPVKTTGEAGTGVGAANGSGIGNANGSGIGSANGTGVGGVKATSATPATKPATTPAKPATTKPTAPAPIKPATKPQAMVKKPVAKKKVI